MNKSCFISCMIILLAFVASGSCLLFPEFYNDTSLIKAVWFGNDLVTFFIVIPMFACSIFFSIRKSLRAYIIWMGLLGYIFYTYSFYLFGAVFNKFFLLYAALVSSSMYALIFGFSNLEKSLLEKSIRWDFTAKLASVFLLSISLPLLWIEVGQCIQFVLLGKIPQVPSLIFALDLTIVVPNSILAAVLLWRKQVWGFMLGMIMLIKAFAYGLSLSVSTAAVAGFQMNGTWDPLLPYYVFVSVGGIICSVLLLRNLKLKNIEV